MKNDFIPRRDGDLDSFEENFMNKIDIHAASLQLDPAEVTSAKNIVMDHRNAFSLMNSKKAESMSATEQNRISKENAVVELRRFAKKMKASKQYLMRWYKLLMHWDIYVMRMYINSICRYIPSARWA